MRRLLLINPNTSASVTTLLARHVGAELERLAPGQVVLQAVTAASGAAYIADEASYALGEQATLAAWRAARTDPADALLIGCFGDPGLLALRAQAAVPATGLAEAAFIEAAGQGGRFAVVTGGERWAPMLTALAQATGFGDSLAGVQAVAATGAELAADPEGARRVLLQACRQAITRWQPSAVIVGGAGLAGMAAQLQPQVVVPLIDSVAAGARQAMRLMRPV